MKERRAVVGFYRDKGKTKPITKSAAELNRKKVVVTTSKHFGGVTPGRPHFSQQQFDLIRQEAIIVAERQIERMGGKVVFSEVVGGMKNARVLHKDVDVLVHVESIAPILRKEFSTPIVSDTILREDVILPVVDIFLIDNSGKKATTQDLDNGALRFKPSKEALRAQGSRRRP